MSQSGARPSRYSPGASANVFPSTTNQKGVFGAICMSMTKNGSVESSPARRTIQARNGKSPRSAADPAALAPGTRRGPGQGDDRTAAAARDAPFGKAAVVDEAAIARAVPESEAS
jgi:hypothetical protein